MLGFSHFQCGVRVWASGFRMRVLRLAAFVFVFRVRGLELGA